LLNNNPDDPRRVYWLVGVIVVAGAASLLAQCALG
jgi:hypothetical protein